MKVHVRTQGIYLHVIRYIVLRVCQSEVRLYYGVTDV